MKQVHPNAVPEPGPPRERGQPAPVPPATPSWPEAPPGLPAYASPSAEVLLDLSFRELVNFYRHSGCGRLCRGLAHRMNSPLQVLSFHLELLEQKSLEEQEFLPEVRSPAGAKLLALHRYRLQKVRQFRRELENLQELVRHIVLQGGHEDAEDRVLLNLNELYRRELDLYQSQPFFQHRVEKQFIFQEDLPPVYGHYIDFSQSFRNILANALEALEGAARRRLTVMTTLEEGKRLLHVGDTGGGIPPEIRPRIFEPFFTTKGDLDQDHAGLGLFMARRLLAPYGGEIRVDSVPGETWVTVALPVE